MKRYDIYISEYAGCPFLQQDEDDAGEWVKYEDALPYIALEEDNAKMQELVKILINDKKELEEENKKLKEQLESCYCKNANCATFGV
jgi:hypothetical protein